MTLVRIEHVRAAKLCASGARRWFAKYNLSWTEFLTNGYPVEIIEATGDALATVVSDIARKEEVNGE